MKAFHSNWTKPFFARNKSTDYYIEDFEILTTMLSALKWQQCNGDIQMVTDKIGAEYYHSLGLEHIWNLGIDDTLGDAVDNQIDPYLFWAAGKIFALQKQETPCIMIDTDFIAWKPVCEKLKDTQIEVIHREEISDSVYPGKLYFDMSKEYWFPVEWDWAVKPCNTALLYISDEGFKDYYTGQAINFMKNLVSGSDTIINMVFAEQRIIAMCAELKGIPIESLLDLQSEYMKEQHFFTHTWGYKSVMKSNFSKRKEFCIRCIRRILRDFPIEAEILSKIKCLELYYKESIYKY